MLEISFRFSEYLEMLTVSANKTEMKLRLSFVVVCSVLLSCLSLTFAHVENHEFHNCVGQYLISKGKLVLQSSEIKKESSCHVQQTINIARDQFNAQVTKEYPSEASCVMAEFDRYELVDYILLFGFYLTNLGVSRADNMIHLERVKGEGNEILNKVTSKCGVDLEKYQEYYGFV